LARRQSRHRQADRLDWRARAQARSQVETAYRHRAQPDPDVKSMSSVSPRHLPRGRLRPDHRRHRAARWRIRCSRAPGSIATGHQPMRPSFQLPEGYSHRATGADVRWVSRYRLRRARCGLKRKCRMISPHRPRLFAAMYLGWDTVGALGVPKNAKPAALSRQIPLP
jgi:hypothetical protein